MDEHKDDPYCFQDRNSSCRKTSMSTSTAIILYIFFSLVSVVTVFLNLLVIISISHFKQLHTPTNLLILSLAVSDLLVGLIVIPATSVAIIEPCWFFGEHFCALMMFITFLCTSSSLCNLVLISIDRFVAVCDPLLYITKITISRIKCYVSINWCCCVIYNVIFINVTVNVQVPMCFKECYLAEDFNWVNIVDLIISMIVPCFTIITLYLKIFVVARSQARKVFSKGAATVSGINTIQANKSERKTAKTIGVVVFNYLICWIPIYFIKLIYDASGEPSSAFTFFLPLVNSLINPIIYALFYPWFKVTAKHFLTIKLRTFKV